jgi:tetratricopeptide (TPR) repeat protein
MRPTKTLAAALALASWLLAPAARADGAAPAKAEEARALFEQAEIHYKLQRYERALAGYEEAYLLVQAPQLLFNIGQCYRLLGRPEEALRSYRAFLAAVPDAADKPRVEALIAELSGRPAVPLDRVPPRRPRLFYGAAAAAGALGLAAGGLFLIERSALRELAEADGSADDAAALLARRRRVATLGTASNALVGAALLSGAVGLAVSRRQRGDLRLAPGLAGLTLSGRF